MHPSCIFARTLRSGAASVIDAMSNECSDVRRIIRPPSAASSGSSSGGIMYLTKHTDYALRVLIFLAQREELSTVREIAAAHGISQNHLMKVVMRLAKLGYVESIRGNGGG